ncbi:hemagglutinin repeat-containing protein [Thiopseudomonas denitrificans]|uniref:Filamentous hemagglutinin family protein n=1 Tax=Thiopseudomonas denitrificans TaxID=1501432 RepID=A0A4R6TUR8_9GAMM|nr:hemagglutinin repeat-containing protein [Thiopseudomonas denitrificans]TDQ37500.1 filamentous hemagglutinin family protein [Thiopseudomonas denitrificans]
MNTQSPLFKTIAKLLIAVMWAQPLHSIAANLNVDHQGGGNTHVTTANNGVPVVNIATPNGNGLSHNKFTDYNVGQQGLILNNSTDKLTQTQLGGIIFGNSQLNGKAANTILNEVTGGQRSQLKGYTEVAGKKAHVIVANPHGITCDGCGFINTPQATLTTGRPMIEQGRLHGYDVDGGDIDIVGAGLNASNISRFDLITRSAKINAELHANELNIITGRNQVEAGTLKATAKTGPTHEQPLLAIDSSALGGMYAGAIRLVGTEAGVGVKLAGDMAASAGDIQIDANGKLTLARVAASKDIRLEAAEIRLEEDAYAGQQAQLITPKLDVQGSLAAGQQIVIEAGQVKNHGMVEAGIKADGSLNPFARMSIQSDQLTNRGQVSSHGTLEVEVQTLDNRQGHIASTRDSELRAEQLLNAQGSIVSQGDLAVDARFLDNASGTLLAESTLALLAQDASNGADGLMAAGANAHLEIAGTLDNAGRLQAGQDLQIEAKKLANSGSLGAGQHVQIVADELHNDQGLLLSGGDMYLAGRDIVNRRGNIYSLGSLLISAEAQDDIGGRFSNLSGTVETVGDILIRADHIENIREEFATRTYKYSARLVHVGCIDCSGTNEDALFRLDEIDRTEVTRNSPQSELLSGGNLLLQADQIDNWYSLLAAANNMHLVAGQVENRGAQTGDVFQSRVLHSHRVRAHRVGYQINDANAFTARNWHERSSYNPGNISAELNSFINTHIQGIRSSSEPVVSNVEYHHGTIQAGGTLHIEAEEQINNSLIRPSFDYVSGGSRADGAVETLVPLNPQQMADLTQQPAGVPEFTLPQGNLGLFRLNTRPGHSYLIETNPALTQMRQFLSSDYLLGELGLNPDNMQKRLGDGLYEQKLIREALIARTGQRYIAGLDSDEALFRYLMDNAIASKDALNLSVGISLSAEQVAALTHDIVWMEQREVMGETVLVPVLYMAQAEGRLAPNGALIQGQDLALISGGDLSNQGTLRARNNLGVQAQNIHNSGLMQAGERLSLLAEGSISNRQGGILAGRDVDLTARTGDILNERSVTHHESALGNSRWETSFADSAARIEAANSLRLNAGRDVQNLGGALQSGGDLQISAGRDVSLSSVEERHSISRGSHYLNRQTAQLISETVAGGALAIDAGRDLTVVASRIESGQDMQLIAGNNLTLAAAANESHHYSKSKKRTSQRDLVQQQGTEVVSGGQFSAVAGNDLMLISSNVTANNEAYLVAGGKVQLLAEQDVDYSFSEKKKKGSFGRKSYRMSESDNSTAVVSSIQAGSNLLIHGAEAIVSQGAQLQAGQHLELQSGGDILLLAAENSSSQASAKSRSGLLSSKGKTSSQSRSQVLGTTAEADSILIRAGQDVRVNAGDLRAQGDMALQAGRDLELSSALQYSSQSQSKHSSTLGFSHHALLTHTQKQQAAEQGSGTAVGSYLSADNLLLSSGRDTAIQGSTLSSERDMHISAGRNLHIVSAENTTHSSQVSRTVKKGEIGKFWAPDTGRAMQNTETQQQTIRQQGSQLQTGGEFTAIAGQDLGLLASTIDAGRGVTLVAGGAVEVLAAQNLDNQLSDGKSKGSLGSKGIKIDERTQTTHIGSSITSGGDLAIISGDGQRYQAAQLTSDADLTLDSGAGIEFEGVKDLEQQSRIRSKNSWVWQSAKGKGHTDETLIQSQLQAQGEIAIRAAERIQIDIKEVNQQSVNQTIDAMVQADPQLAWLKDMQQRGDVDWRQVKELHDSFSYSSSGLSGPAAMVIAIVVAYFTAGAASGAIGAAAGAGAGSGGAMAAAGTATASAVASGAAAGSTIAAGWANATLSGILAGAAGGAAGAASQGQDWRDAALSGAITGGFAGYLSAGTYYNNPINTAGKITEYVGSGEWMSLSKEVSRLGMNQAFGYVQSKVAKEVGLKPEELNWALMAGSIAGNRLKSVGSRLSKSNEDFYKSNGVGIRGVLNREIRGLPFDAIDIALGYQGLPDATVQSYLSKLGLDNDLLAGHSLGTLTNIYLGSNGLAEKVYLYSVPFGAVAPTNAEVMIGSWDLVNGGWAGKLFNWDAEVVPLKPWEHGYENYKRYIKD